MHEKQDSTHILFVIICIYSYIFHILNYEITEYLYKYDRLLYEFIVKICYSNIDVCGQDCSLRLRMHIQNKQVSEKNKLFCR